MHVYILYVLPCLVLQEKQTKSTQINDGVTLDLLCVYYKTGYQICIHAYLNGDSMGYINTFLPLFRADEGRIRCTVKVAF